MTLYDFKTMAQIKTQDAQSKLPSSFPQWKLVIEEGIKKLEVETELEIATTDLLVDDTSNIPIIDDLLAALVFYVSQLFTNDITLKQKFIVDYEDAKGTFLWNKFKEMELSI